MSGGPDAGSPGTVMPMLIARSAPECRLYIDLNPCSCGEWSFDVRHTLRSGPDGALIAVYEGACPRCGLPRRFEFALDPATPPPPPAYGGPRPSRIICPGQFALVADHASRASGRDALARAIAAQQEVIKFIPAGADEVPAEAFTSWEGRALYAREPGRFRRYRLEAVAEAYRDALAGYEAA
jgi:hypothetical protein